LKIQFILKSSTITDIQAPWVGMGGADNTNEGGFTFDGNVDYEIEGGVIRVYANGSVYVYNITDFYRVKITN